MKPLAFALVSCALFLPPAWADDGQDGAAQRLPFSKVERGTQNATGTAESGHPSQQGRAASDGARAGGNRTRPTGGGGPNQSTTGGGAGDRSPLDALPPPTLEDEVARLIDGMLQALRALDRVGSGPDGEARLRRLLDSSLADLQPGSTAIKEFLGPDQHALTEGQLAEATETFRKMLQGALESDDPRAFLASRRAILEQPGFTDRAAAYMRQQQERGAPGMITSRIDRPSVASQATGGSGPSDAMIESFPYLPGHPGHVIDPSTGQVFRRAGNHWERAPDPR